jgi:O-antigen/teichoic acid export membrane protein
MSRSHLVARNLLVTLVTQLVLWSLTFGVTLYLPRYLKDTGLGTLTLVGSYASILSVLVGLGTSTVLIKEIARSRARTAELVFASLLMRSVLGVITIALGWAGARLLQYSPSLQTYTLIALAVMVVAQISDVLLSALAGLEEFPKQNAALLAEKVMSSCLAISLVIFRQPLWMFVAVALISSATSICFSSFMLRQYLRKAGQLQWNSVLSTIPPLARAGVPFLMVGIFGAVYGQCDALLLSKISSVAAIGWYSLAKRLGGTTLVIPVALCTTMLPTLSRMHREDKLGFNAAVRRLLNLMLICVVPFSTALVLAPGQIVSLLHYPESYRNSIPVLMLMGSAIVLWYLSQAVGTALIASDRQAIFSRITGFAALASVPLCAACIMITQRTAANGAVGAMFSDALLELFMVIAYIRALPEGIFGRRIFLILGRCVLASLPFAISLYAMSSRRDLIWPILGLALYPLACYLLRCLSPDDLQILKQFTRRLART